MRDAGDRTKWRALGEAKSSSELLLAEDDVYWKNEIVIVKKNHRNYTIVSRTK